MKNFPYVLADKGATSTSRMWQVMSLDPKTGKRAAAGQPDALNVWAYRGRPVYTCARDKKAGDAECDTWGEFYGWRNGYKAFWLRDDFGDNDE
jgi:predicted lipoprotein with Yx(FWY)xxD motif